MAVAKKRKATKRKVGAVAKRRTTRRIAAPRRRTTRRRKVGGIDSDIMTPLAVVGGLIGARFIQKMLPTSISTQTQAIIMTGIGFGGYMFLKDKLAKDVSTGVAASGVLSLAQGFGIVSGLTANGQNPYVLGAPNRPRRRMPARIHGVNPGRIQAPNPIRKMGFAQSQLMPMIVGSMG